MRNRKDAVPLVGLDTVPSKVISAEVEVGALTNTTEPDGLPRP
jgi:hypothetical protein